MYEQRIKVPKDRIGVFIGEKGEAKRDLEETLGVSFHMDSQEGEVTLRSEDSLKLYAAQEVVKAIARGFNPEVAKRLLKTEYVLEMLNITDYADTQKQMIRLKGRVIGENGKSRATIEQLSDTNISVYGKTISIVGDVEAAQAAKRAVDALLSGAPHSTVFKLLEKLRRERNRKELAE